MLKKLAFGIVGFALAATPAFATVFTLPTVVNTGSVKNIVKTNSNTGGNSTFSFSRYSHSVIVTGDATSVADVETGVGAVGGFLGSATNTGGVLNVVKTNANTGHNFSGSGFIGTGDASSTSIVLTTVSSSVSGF